MSTISWPHLCHLCTSTPFEGFLDAIPEAITDVEDCDVWLWDFQRRALTSVKTAATCATASELGGATSGSAHTSQIRYQGDELGYLVITGPDTLPELPELASFMGTALRASEPTTDVINVRRRRRDMSLPAEMQWALLPPTQFALPDGHLTAAVEPAYDTGGDVFDYALDGNMLFLAVLDARGHGLRAATTSHVATSAMRRSRRAGEDLLTIAEEVGTSVSAMGDDQEFVSAVLAQINIETWQGSWLSAGHLAPLVIGDDVAELALTPTLPLGLTIAGHRSTPTLEHFELPPGSALSLYSDGIIENVTLEVGDPLGDAQFHSALRRRVQQPASPTASAHPARDIVNDLLALTGSVLRDDATLMVLQRPA